MWYAKPSGGYAITSTEGKENMYEMRDILLNNYGYTYEAITGVIANSIYEGGLNPWRWESDTYPPTADRRGCGLFGYTPYARYLAMEGSEEMNLSVTTVTQGASPNVGSQQMRIMADGTWGWVSTCWRNYWDTTTYADQYALRQNILDIYGDGNTLTQAQYANIRDINAAVFAFLACFEGPNIPNYESRKSVASEVYQIITEEPVPPIPVINRKLPIYMMLRRF